MKITRISTTVVNARMRNWVFVRVDTDVPGLFGLGEATLEFQTRGVVGAVEDLSLLILGFFLAAWQIGTMPFTSAQTVDDEYAKLVGAAASTGQKSAFPTPMDVGRKLVEQLSDPFYDKGPNDKGIGI